MGGGRAFLVEALQEQTDWQAGRRLDHVELREGARPRLPAVEQRAPESDFLPKAEAGTSTHTWSSRLPRTTPGRDDCPRQGSAQNNCPPGERSTTSDPRSATTLAPSSTAAETNSGTSSTQKSMCAPPEPGPTACTFTHASAPSGSRVTNSSWSPRSSDRRVSVTAVQKSQAAPKASRGRSMKAYVHLILMDAIVEGPHPRHLRGP